MKRIVTVIVLAIGGLVAATALTLSALALAGGDIGDVVHPRLDEQSTTQTRSVSNSPSPSDRSPSETPSADDHSSASEPADDHGGGDNSGSGSDDSGSDNSGSGSDNSGSGSGGSGSGHSDDD